jgi:hypothetical protein
MGPTKTWLTPIGTAHALDAITIGIKYKDIFICLSGRCRRAEFIFLPCKGKGDHPKDGGGV